MSKFGGDRYHSGIPECLQEFTENLVDERVPDHRDSHASSCHKSSLEMERKVVSGKHSIYTHFPKDRNCKICERTDNFKGSVQKTCWWSRTSCRKSWWLDNSRSQSSQRRMWISKQSPMCSRGQRLGYSMDSVIFVQDKNFSGNWKELAKVLGADSETRNYLHWQFLGVWQDLWRPLWNHRTSTPHRSETNKIAESATRRIKEGASQILLQSDLDEQWWADSMECQSYLRNVQNLLSDGKTPCEKRFGEPSKGPIIPYGSLVEHHPISTKDQSRFRQFGKRVSLGIFLGYVLYAGVNFEKRHCGCGHWGVGQDGRTRNPNKKA